MRGVEVRRTHGRLREQKHVVHAAMHVWTCEIVLPGCSWCSSWFRLSLQEQLSAEER